MSISAKKKRIYVYLIIWIILVCCLATGCSKIEKNNVDMSHIKTENGEVPEAIEKIEVMNIYNDASIYSKIREKALQEVKNIASESEDVKVKKAYIILNNYIFDLYKLATTRVATDIDTIYTNSNEYMAYIALLQTFADCYSKEQKDLQKAIIAGDKKAVKMKSFIMQREVDDYYLNIIKEVNKSDNNEKDEIIEKKDKSKEINLDDYIKSTS